MIQAFHEIQQWIQIDKLTLMVHYHLLLLLNHFECSFFIYFLVFLYNNVKGKRLEKCNMMTSAKLPIHAGHLCQIC